MSLALLVALIALLSPRPVLPTSTAGIACVSAAFPPSDASRAVAWHVINLDDPPEKRWTPLIEAKKTQMAALIAHIKTVPKIKN